jgi:hypothetical protein
MLVRTGGTRGNCTSDGVHSINGGLRTTSGRSEQRIQWRGRDGQLDPPHAGDELTSSFCR